MMAPKVSLENYEAVYDYYAPRRPVLGMTKFLHGLFGTVIHPRTEYQDDARQRIIDHFSSGGLFLLVAKHVHAADPLFLASLAKRETALNPLMGNVIIQGKAPIFKVRPIKPFIDNFPAFPTFREEEVKASKLPYEEAKGMQREATKCWVDINVTCANEGMNIAMFPEATRKVSGVRSGLGQITSRLEEPERFQILSVAIDCSQGFGVVRPSIYVAQPYDVPPTPELVTSSVETSLKFCYQQVKSM